MLVHNANDELFLGERAGQSGHWQFPQGGVEESDSLEQAVFRELAEELGLTARNSSIVKQLRATFQYDWDDPPSYARGRWRGQTQTFWLIEFVGSDQEIVLDKGELSSWRWASVQQVRELAHPKRMPGYLLPLREYEDYLLLRGELELP